MKSNKARTKFIGALGRAILVAAILLMVLNAAGGVSAVGPPSPSQGPESQEAPTRPPPLKPPPPRTGGILPPVDLSHLKGDKLPKGVRAAALPSKWDWRAQGVVTSVKDQGPCGSCYAFGSVGNIESKMLIDGAGLYDFSENNAKECNWRELNNYEYPPGTRWGSCDGGNYFMLASLFSQKGTVLESCDPYAPSDVDCNDTCPYIKTLLDWRIIAGSVPDTDVLKAYIQTYGPIFTFVYAGDGDAWQTEFRDYDGSYTLYYPGTEDPNHTVLIVGWDDSVTHAGGKGGWIVKNSWGTDWGGPCGYGTERGYFTIAYGSASIGMLSSFMYDWQDYDPDGDIMYYDEDGGSAARGYGDTTAWGLVKFFPSSDTNITRVEFWTNDKTTDVDVYMYDHFDGTTLSNLVWSSLNHSFAEAGYHGVAVDPRLAVTSGDDIIAVVKFTNDSYGYPIAADKNGPIETRRTYISRTGTNGTWDDLGEVGRDVAIRLRTSTVTPPPGFKIYLPLLLKNYVPGVPTPTPTPTITPTLEPTSAGARGRILWNDDGASGAYSRLCQDYNSILGTCSGRQYNTRTDTNGWYEHTDIVPDSYCQLVRLADESVWWYRSLIFGCKEITIKASEITIIDDYHLYKTDLVLLSPPDDSTVDTNQPTLVWAAYPSAAYYKVWLRRGFHYATKPIFDYVRVDGTSITVPEPLSGGEYNWFVKAYNVNGRLIARNRGYYYFTVPGPL